MNINPESIKLTEEEGILELSMNGEVCRIHRIAKAFPKSEPDRYVGLMDENGHEIGIIEDPEQLDESSRELLAEKLKSIYFVPTIYEVESVTSQGTGSFWKVLTDDGDHSFRITGRDALDGNDPPDIEITSETGRRYRIENYWALDSESRNQMSDLLPDKILRNRTPKMKSSRSSKF